MLDFIAMQMSRVNREKSYFQIDSKKVDYKSFSQRLLLLLRSQKLIDSVLFISLHSVLCAITPTKYYTGGGITCRTWRILNWYFLACDFSFKFLKRQVTLDLFSCLVPPSFPLSRWSPGTLTWKDCLSILRRPSCLKSSLTPTPDNVKRKLYRLVQPKRDLDGLKICHLVPNFLTEARVNEVHS